MVGKWSSDWNFTSRMLRMAVIFFPCLWFEFLCFFMGFVVILIFQGKGFWDLDLGGRGLCSFFMAETRRYAINPQLGEIIRWDYPVFLLIQCLFMIVVLYYTLKTRNWRLIDLICASIDSLSVLLHWWYEYCGSGVGSEGSKFCWENSLKAVSEGKYGWEVVSRRINLVFCGCLRKNVNRVYFL